MGEGAVDQKAESDGRRVAHAPIMAIMTLRKTIYSSDVVIPLLSVV